ncbi:BAR-domain-containing protein [Mycena sanguinolenta]|uniref:BAR-domain-containing protein n=1 Tax=Mycena sanguinolenta TaxID=230812 RepID=A0A8H6Z0B8_9AGAR|nr:BAR-domain-containing protein [Mycena sanguinolenta]
MAGKQLGKLRQWAGEVISSSVKTTVSDEFRALEKDVELRRDGAQRLHLASEVFHKNLAKRKDNGALDDAEKLMPVDALGIVMIIHGEEFGEDSPFGNSLVSLGRAHCKVAKLQEQFAQSFHDSFMASLVRFAEDIKDYEALRKKLESRRLSYDAATAKHEKMRSSKKEKERKEAEEEYQRAKQRYDETEEEVEAHMHAIQENEIVQLRELTNFLTLELNYVEQYAEVLKETRANWPSDSPPVRHAAPSHAKKTGSVRSRKSDKPPSRRTSESSEDEGTPSRPSSRPSSRPPSRPASRGSRPRSDSAGTAGGDKRRLSMAGWATSAVGSVTGRSKKSKDKDAFASLTDEGERDSGHGESDNASTGGGAGILHSITRRKSASSNAGGSTTPKLPTRILKPPSQVPRKVVRALYDFSGSSDELAFKAGDTIVVVNEVLDGWWMGELNGKQGLFPTPYTEAVHDRPPLPSRAGRSNADHSDDSRDMYNDDDEDPDSDANEHYGRPVTAASPFYGGPSDAASIVSSVADEDDDERNLISASVNRMAPTLASASTPPPMPRRSTTSELLNAGGTKQEGTPAPAAAPHDQRKRKSEPDDPGTPPAVARDVVVLIRLGFARYGVRPVAV